MTLVQTEPKKIYIRVDEQWWQPWVNTLLYLPLQNDAIDQTRNYTITADNISFSNNKAVFNNSWTSCLTVNETSFPNTFTLHIIAQMTTASGYQLLYRHCWRNSSSWTDYSYDNSRCYLYGYSSWIQLWMANGSTVSPWITADTNEHLYSWVVQSNQMKFYIDGVLKYTYNAAVWNYYDAKISFWNRWYNPNEWLKWTMREVIAESTYRTDDEVRALAEQFGFSSWAQLLNMNNNLNLNQTLIETPINLWEINNNSWSWDVLTI